MTSRAGPRRPSLLEGLFDGRLGGRAILIVGAYGGAMLVGLIAIVLARQAVPPGTLKALLGFFFISNTASGLEPGTAKAAALQPGGALARPTAAYVLAGAVKAVAVSPALALVWRFADPAIPLAALAWVPLMCVAGFGGSDLRALYDIRGRHAAATGLKQGLNGLGYAVAGALMVAGVPLWAAIGASTLGRLLALAGAARLAGPGGDGDVWTHTRDLLFRTRWLDFAGTSVVGSASGSMDRVLGLRLLAPAAFSVYYLSFEGLSRFLVIPYLLTPIIFARAVSGLGSAALIRGAIIVIGAGGAAMLALIAVVMPLAPQLVTKVVGADLPGPTLVLALAMIVNAVTQLRFTQLQAAGRTRAALLITCASGLVAGGACYAGARFAGAAGLMYAALAKTTFELALAFACPLGSRTSSQGPWGAFAWARRSPPRG